MDTSRLGRIVLCLFLVLLANGAVQAGGKKATSKPAKPKLLWGPAKAGLQVSLSFEDKVAVGGKFKCKIALRNIGKIPVKLPDGDRLFAWLFIAQNTTEGKKAFYTDRCLLAKGLKNWPAELGSGKKVDFGSWFISHDVATNQYVRGLKIVEGYPTAQRKLRPEQLKQVHLHEAIVPGQALVRVFVYFRGESPSLLQSNTVKLDIAPPDLKSLSPKQRKAYVAKLVKKFDKSAWSGQAAHRQAVKSGKAVVPALIKAVFERNRPAHSRMWLATALADIRDERAAKALIKLLHDGLRGVRHVAAYHGPKQRSDKLDKAIVKRTLELKESRMTALAMLGFLVFRGEVNEQLLEASLESPDPRVRATAIHALSQFASTENVKKLTALLKDKNPRVRRAAAKALEAMKKRQ